MQSLAYTKWDPETKNTQKKNQSFSVIVIRWYSSKKWDEELEYCCADIDPKS